MSPRSAAALAAVLAAVLACDAGLEPEPICARGLVGLCGTIHFRGTIPDSTDNVFAAAYAIFPQTCNDLIFNRQPFIPSSVPYTDSVAQYGIPLPADRYAWVLAVYYRDPADSTQPRAVTVTSGPAIGDVDFRVDFDSLRPATDFVTCTAQ